jgi:hypothetical protein
MASAGAGDKVLSNWTVYSGHRLDQAFVKPAHADAAGEMAGVDPVPYAANQWQFLPMTPSTPPISAAAKQQHQNDDDEDQFH